MEIFEWHCTQHSLSVTVFRNEKTERYDDYRVFTPALDISQTCALWRNIAISMPALWSNMVVDLNCGRDLLVDVVALYLSRSSPALLELWIRAQDGLYYADYMKESGQSIFAALVKDSHRWKIVDFDMSILAFRDFHHSMTGTGCVNLEELRFPSNTDVDSLEEEVDLFCRILGRTPILQSAQFRGPWAERFIEEDQLPFEVLLDLDIKGWAVNLTQLRDLLDCCENLENLYVIPDYDLIPIIPPPQLNHISHCPNLVELLVDVGHRLGSDSACRGIIAAAYFFRILRAPSLGILSIEGKNDNNEEQSVCFNSLKGFLQVSKCQLETLDLIGDLLDTDMVLELLELLPALEELEISEGRDRFRLLKALQVSQAQAVNQAPTRKCLLPKLATISFAITLEYEDLGTGGQPVPFSLARSDPGDEEKVPTGMDGGGFTEDAPDDQIYAMLCSRRNSPDASVRNLDHFKFSVRRGMAPSTQSVVQWLDGFRRTTEPRLRALAREGLQLELDIQM
ncbi:hypothetical protein D9758_012899 [Tetrapyrgos nigripes]|uniref:Uncharacterized protein n=1 Tax=Tetrapyrgos nigripes TaxID=182062 RepID=A0A8H5CMI7_9AGAR|nr:hypothetical protein D9758_012899 [Tetrapyrgos nigripes]